MLCVDGPETATDCAGDVSSREILCEIHGMAEDGYREPLDENVACFAGDRSKLMIIEQ